MLRLIVFPDTPASWHTVTDKMLSESTSPRETSSIGNDEHAWILFDVDIALYEDYSMTNGIEDCFSYNIFMAKLLKINEKNAKLLKKLL